MAVHILRRLKATHDAEAIADYIAKDSLEAALRFLENTESTLSYLAEFPSIGSPFATDYSEFVSLRTCRVHGFPNHVIYYVEHKKSIEIVRILHGARDADVELRNQ